MMFDQTFVDTAARTKKPWTVAASLTVQLAGVAVLLALPMLHPEVLRLAPPVTVPMIYRITQPPLVQQAVQQINRTTTTHSAFVPPRPIPFVTRVPSELKVIAADNLPVGMPLPPGVGSNLIGGADVLSAPLTGPIAPPKPVQPKPEPKPVVERPSGPVNVSTGVQASKLIFGPAPPYPPIARTTRTQGTVVLRAIIAEDGSIQNLQLVSGPPLLVRAAVDAVSRWRYQPTLLSGRPVQVTTEISVNFTLNGN